MYLYFHLVDSFWWSYVLEKIKALDVEDNVLRITDVVGL